MTVTTNRSDGGVDFRLDLDTDRLLPGRIATGSVHIAFGNAIEVRGIVASLIATETWQHEDTTTDADGTRHTETHTIIEELQRLPVMLAGPGALSVDAVIGLLPSDEIRIGLAVLALAGGAVMLAVPRLLRSSQPAA